MSPSLSRILFVAILLSALAAIACNPAPAKEDQDKDWVNPEDLAQTSDRIISGIFMEEKTEVIDSEDDDLGPRDVIYRQFKITESFKGTADVDDTIWMGFDPAIRAILRDGVGAEQSIDPNKEYVLFLKGRARPLDLPSEYGAVFWTGNGQPSLAEVDEGRLKFRSDDVYLDLLEQRTILIPDDDSAAAFRLTLDRLRELTD